jgi:hypothetical protein
MVTGRAGWLAGGIGLLTLALATSPLAIFAAPATGEAEKPAKKVAAKQPGVRLPPHFASVVTEEQREKILAVQEEYASQLREKRQELKAVVEKRDAAIMKLLKPEQRKQVEQAREEAKARRAAAMAESDKPAANKSAKADK